jgi:UDP-N-acetylglucosamine--N-acetylmuramyl-(pentapeptide) pyrophosphoryl-undecaprenol N-acetylglucosamine transferase
MRDKSQPNHSRVMIMAGGTGGHVFPALAVAEILMANNVDVSWLGTRKGIESKLIPQRGIDLNYLNIEGLRGRGLLALLKAPFKLLSSVLQACSVINQFKPSVVLGMGGFASGPGAVAAKLKGIPLVIHEQNSVAGTTNKLSAKFATKIMQGFPNTFKQAEWCGNPIRSEIAALHQDSGRLENRSGPLRVLVLGGSRGALAINKILPQALAEIDSQQRPEVLHQVGSQHLKLTQNLYLEQGHDVCSSAINIVPFIDKMDEAYAWADFVICRSGALTVAELTAVGLGAFLIPFPHAIDDHQTVNGQWLVDSGAAEMQSESKLTPQKLADYIKQIANNRDQCIAMSQCAKSIAKLGAADRVAEACMEVANG